MCLYYYISVSYYVSYSYISLGPLTFRFETAKYTSKCLHICVPYYYVSRMLTYADVCYYISLGRLTFRFETAKST